MKKIVNIFKKPKNILLYLMYKGWFNFLTDENYLKLEYKIIMNEKLNLKDPKTFNEKLQWLKLYDRNPEYTKMVDKYEAKKYVSNLIGEEYIIPTLGIYDNFNEINFDKLPNQFVMKCTHDSGSSIICKDKSKFDFKIAKNIMNKKLKKNYFYMAREWPYKNVKPRIIIEKYMTTDEKEELTDYKLMCFNGEVKCSFVCLDRNSDSGLKVDFYDLEWKKMPFERHYPNSKITLPKPKNYDLMIELAEKLAREISFVRVDFYEIDGRIYFGELTFFPGAGLEEFTPEKYDEILGDMLELPREKREKNEK